MQETPLCSIATKNLLRTKKDVLMAQHHTLPINKLIFMACFLHACTSMANVIVPGNHADPRFSFPFLTTYTTNNSGQLLYVGAAGENSKEFAISIASTSPLVKNGNSFKNFIKEKIKLNGAADKPNPLLNAHINHLSMMEVAKNFGSMSEYLIAVTAQEPATVYLFENGESLLSSTAPDATIPDLKNPVIHTTSEIISMVTGGSSIFAAVKPHDSNTFGDLGSGIATITLQTKEVTKKKEDPEKKDSAEKKNVSVQKNSSEKKDASVKEAEEPKVTINLFAPVTTCAFALDNNIKALKIENNEEPIAILNNAVILYWHATLQRLFIGLQVTPNAHSLLVGHLENNILNVRTAVPRTVFTDTDNALIGSKNTHSSIHEINSLCTSTHRHYLIVRGGTDEAEHTRNSIYALPLIVQSPHKILVGTMACAHALCATEAATTPEDMTTANNPAALIGSGSLPLAYGDVIKMDIKGDTVFVATKLPATTAASDITGGIFYSQALFDNQGAIKRWTEWQRYTGSTDALCGMVVNNKTGHITTLSTTNNSTDNTTETTVLQTEWGAGSDHYSAHLLRAVGPTEHLFDFPALHTPGLKTISVLASCHQDTITLAQTSTIIHDAVTLHAIASPTKGEVTHAIFNNGTLTEGNSTAAPTVITIKGGALSEISPIAHVAMAQTGPSGWLFCGGYNGLAVLSTPDHAGWTSLDAGFKGLSADMTFKKVGNYTNIKKIIIDGDYLYVLTNKALDRITISGTTLNPGHIRATRMASVGETPFAQEFSFFTDLVISDKLALIATSHGLYRVGNGKSITHAREGESVNWTLVPIPQNNNKTVAHLYVKSSTGYEQDCAKNNTDGLLYILSSDRSRRTQLNRFSIASVESDGVTESTLLPICTESYHAYFNEHKDLFATDGALSFHACGHDNNKPANLQLMHGGPINADIKNGRNTPSMVYCSGLGTWLIGNEKGISTNE